MVDKINEIQEKETTQYSEMESVREEELDTETNRRMI